MQKTRIMGFGTFDGLHKGHLNFFKQAKKTAKNPYLIIAVARDCNVKRIKGKSPEFSEIKRLNLLKKSKIVDKVLLASKNNQLSFIWKMKPNIIVFGYDQKEYTKNLKKYIKDNKISIKIIRLKPYKKHIYKSHLLKK
ncbi:MAG TPA: adenylyltransferase/cytidyltransferase family protein [Candidatus Paceibacterota bacterium]|nr:adenylyltransferase/cytidyltransferase family protein [Candidatus Paceibacterota bacterium]HPT18339.1 adenylyltransferase/cytidyltransferase family protein [Candidatus Paceibacterota bacterium]